MNPMMSNEFQYLKRLFWSVCIVLAVPAAAFFASQCLFLVGKETGEFLMRVVVERMLKASAFGALFGLLLGTMVVLLQAVQWFRGGWNSFVEHYRWIVHYDRQWRKRGVSCNRLLFPTREEGGVYSTVLAGVGGLFILVSLCRALIYHSDLSSLVDVLLLMGFGEAAILLWMLGVTFATLFIVLLAVEIVLRLVVSLTC